MAEATATTFEAIVRDIPQIGKKCHQNTLIQNAQLNLPDSKKSIRQLAPLTGVKQQSGIIISAGPSVRRKNSIERIVKANYKGSIIATDGTYIACLKAGLIPDFVLTLDPHPTRVVRWFGDHNFEEQTKNDDYFSRQDLDVEFRKNSIEQNKQHIELVNEYGHLTKAIVASVVSRNVVQRLKEAKFDMYWWNPLVDDPSQSEDSLTRKLYAINKLPCLNTGGTVGVASWVFTHSSLKPKVIGMVGMDFGYYADTPKEKTQTYYELKEHLADESEFERCFVDYEFPGTQEKFYTDPTYYWYRKNFFELLEQSQIQTFNCTEAGTLFGKNVVCLNLDHFFEKYC